MQKVNVPSIPRAQKVLGRANCLSSDEVGDCVTISGPKTGTIYSVTKFDPLTSVETKAVGIITKKHSSTLCRVQFFGPLVDVYTSLTPGRRYFVGKDSKLTVSRPSPLPGETLYIQLMGTAFDNSELFLLPEDPTITRG